MKQKLRPLEVFMNLLFFVCGLIAVVFVLFISIYLIVSGLPAIREIGWWTSSSAPSGPPPPPSPSSAYCLHPYLHLRHRRGHCPGRTGGLHDRSVLAKVAPPRLASLVRPAVDLLGGPSPSVVYGLIGMMVLVPAVRVAFHLPTAPACSAAILALAVMILPPSSPYPRLPSRRCPRSTRRPRWPWAPPTSRPCSG